MTGTVLFYKTSLTALRRLGLLLMLASLWRVDELSVVFCLLLVLVVWDLRDLILHLEREVELSCHIVSNMSKTKPFSSFQFSKIQRTSPTQRSLLKCNQMGEPLVASCWLISLYGEQVGACAYVPRSCDLKLFQHSSCNILWSGKSTFTFWSLVKISSI